MNIQKHELSKLEDMYDDWWRDRASWKLKFTWFPKKCAISDRLVWLDFAYCGTLMFTGPGDPVVEYRWHDADEHLVWLLK